MIPTYEVTSAPASEPVSLADMKAYLRLESGVTADDDLISDLITEAREWVEDYTEQKLITQTITQTLDRWPGSRELIELPQEGRVSDVLYGGKGWVELLANPVQSITSVTVYDDAGGSAVWSADNYRLATGHRARLALEDGAAWPSATRATDAIEIVYVAGFGDADAVPGPFKAAIKKLVASAYENRESEIIGSITAEMKFSVDRILGSKRVMSL